MNIQEYISSGIIESYVLGLASPEESKEFEMMCEQHAEVEQARIAFELSLEKQAIQNSIDPPVEIKQKVLDKISFPGRVIPLSTTPVRNINWLKYAVVACIILLAGSLFLNISLYTKNKKLKNNLDNSIAQVSDIEKDIHTIQQNPNIKIAAMKGTGVSPLSFATVYWDTTSHDVYLLVNNLPKPASDKQYQLWAFINNKPVDMGLLELTEKPLQLYRMKNTQSAQAFAITLEKRGNGPIPQGAVYVKGNP